MTPPETPPEQARPRRSLRQWLHDLSLTTRLVTVVVALTLTAFVVSTALTVAMMRDYLVERVDSDLQSAIQPLGGIAVDRWFDQPGRQIDTDSLIPPTQRYVIQITGPDQRTETYHYPQTNASTPALGAIMVNDERLHTPFTVAGQDDDSDSWRVLVWPIAAEGSGAAVGTVALATPLNQVDNTVKQLVLLITIVGLGVITTVALLAWFAVRRAFRPLTRIEDTAKAIAGGDLTRRIPERHGKDEVASLSTSLNTMLARIEQAFAMRAVSERRMRQFVADASHELRTPLATVRGYAELYRVGGIDKPADVASAMSRIEGEAQRMTRLVDDLLLLTRIDSQRGMQRSIVDLTVLVADTVQDARVRAPDRDIRMMWPRGQTGPVLTSGDDHALRQVLANLVGNALAHTPEGTDVEVALARAGAAVMIEVRDHGHGIPPELAPKVFERFFRADASRNRDRGGTGLGLAIVAAIVGSHGGRVRYRQTPGGGATFRVELPAAKARHEDETEEAQESISAPDTDDRPRLSAKSQDGHSTSGD